MDLANQAQVQVSMDVDYPESSQIITTVIPPAAPTLALVTGPAPSPVTITIPGNVLNVPTDGSATEHVTIPNTGLVAVHAILVSVALATEVNPFSSLSPKSINAVLSGDGTLDFDVVVTGGLPGTTCQVNYSVEGN